MVHLRPSTGCKRCRERHIKCDETKPICKKCTSRSLECPGYRDTCGVVFKDLSNAVYAKQAKRAARVSKQNKRLKTRLPLSIILDSEETEQASLAFPPILMPGPETVAVNFFFREYILCNNRDWTASQGHFDHLIPLYNSTSPESPLALTITAMAGCKMSLELLQGVSSPWHQLALMKAITAIRTSIANPVASVQDETLLAVLCLNFIEQLRSRTSSSPPNQVHQHGALALVLHRGADNFKSHVSRALLSATRSNALQHALWSSSPSPLLEPPFSIITDEEHCTPATALDKLIAELLQVRKLAQESRISDNWEHDRHTIAWQAQGLYTRLSQWSESLPPSWIPVKNARPDSHVTSPLLGPSRGVEIYSNVMTAYVYNQWRCTKLTALRLLENADLQANEPPPSSQMSVNDLKQSIQDILYDICSAVSYFVRDCYFADECDPIWRGDISAALQTNRRLCYRGGAPAARWFLVNVIAWTLSILQPKDKSASQSGSHTNNQECLDYLEQQYKYLVSPIRETPEH